MEAAAEEAAAEEAAAEEAEVPEGAVLVLALVQVVQALVRVAAPEGGSGGTDPSPVHNVCKGRPFTLHGVVIGIIGPRAGQGFSLWSDEKVVNIYGIGPARFWQAKQVPPLSVGQRVTVEGFRVDYNGIERSLAARLHLPDGTLVLRSANGCQPVWRRNQTGRGKALVVPTR